MAPLVSVIIPCYNGTQYLEQAVSSVIRQKYKNLECIIVDDGSTDHTPELCQHLIQQDSRIKYVHQQNGGPASARNRGIKASKGDWIQLLDADDWLHTHKIKFQLEYLRKTAPNANQNLVLFSDYHVINVDSHQQVLNEETQIFGHLTENQLLDRILTWSFRDDCPLHCNNVLLKRSVFDKFLFNETSTAFTDLEFFARLLTHNVNFMYTPIIGMYFRRHPKSRTTNKKYTQEAYVGYLELLYEGQKELLDQIPHIENKIQIAYYTGNKDLFHRLLKIYEQPVCLPLRSINIKNRMVLKMAFWLKLVKRKTMGPSRSNVLRLSD